MEGFRQTMRAYGQRTGLYAAQPVHQDPAHRGTRERQEWSWRTAGPRRVGAYLPGQDDYVDAGQRSTGCDSSRNPSRLRLELCGLASYGSTLNQLPTTGEPNVCGAAQPIR